MGSADILQDFVVVTLDAQADPVETFAAQSPQKPQIYRIRIGLKGDFRRGGDLEAFADGVHNLRQTFCSQKTGGAAAKINGVHIVFRRQNTGLPNVGTHRIQIITHTAVVGIGDGVKITVVAFAAAEGHMDINAKRFFVVSWK